MAAVIGVWTTQWQYLVVWCGIVTVVFCGVVGFGSCVVTLDLLIM